MKEGEKGEESGGKRTSPEILFSEGTDQEPTEPPPKTGRASYMFVLVFLIKTGGPMHKHRTHFH